MSLTRIGKGIRYLIVLNVVQVAATLIFYSIISQFLSKDEVGLVTTFTFVYTILTTLSQLALPVAGTKYVAEFLSKGEKEKASTAARSVVRLALLNSSIIASGFHIVLFLSMTDFSTMIPFSLVCIASFLASLKLTYLALVRGLQHFDRVVIANSSTTITSYIAGVFFVLKFRSMGFTIGILTGELVGLGLTLLFYYGQFLKTTSSYDYKTLLKFSLPVFVMQVVVLFSDWADRILFFAVSLNLAWLGVYDLTIRSAASLLFIVGFIESIMLPIFTKAYSQLGKKDVTLLLQRVLRYLGFMYFPAAFGLAAVSKTVITLLYGPAYIEGAIPLAILSVSSVFMAFSLILGSALKSLGKTTAFIKISLASLTVNVIMIVSLTPFIGIIGATLARIISSFLVFILFFHELGGWINIEIDSDGLWKGLLSSLVSAALIFCFDALHLSSALINLLVGTVLGFLSYVVALILLRALRREDFDIFRQILPLLTPLIDFVERIV